MGSDDLTIKVLIEIRDELRAQSSRIDQTNASIDQTNAKVDQLGLRIVESELRTATALTDLAGSVREVKVLLRDRFDLRDRVERCEQDIADLKKRVG